MQKFKFVDVLPECEIWRGDIYMGGPDVISKIKIYRYHMYIAGILVVPNALINNSYQ